MKRGVCIGALSFLVLFQSPVFADGINGTMELNYNASNSSSTTDQGSSTKSSSDSFQQRYRLSFDKSLYPNLKWSAGGTFEKNDGTASTDGIETTSASTKFAPRTDLTLKTPFINAGVGFNRIEEKQSSSGTSQTNFRDTYFANLGLRPVELPNLNISFQRANTYDKDRATVDRTNDSLSLNSRYSPLKGLDLGYQGNFNSSSDLLKDLRVEAESHRGRATYSLQMLRNRVSINAGYDISQNTTKVISVGAGEGEIISPELPIAGLAGIDDPPAVATDDALPVMPDLINNLTGSGPANIALNIGFLNRLDTRTRNFGVDFGIGNDREVNTLYVYVSDAVNIITVADSFAWEVYAGSDSTDSFALRHWTLQPITSVIFNPFDRRFEIKFPNVKTRLLKAVTRPLSVTTPAAGNSSFENIFVTEIQTFIRKPVGDVPKKDTKTSQTYDFNVRTRLFNYPLISHDLYYSHTGTNKDGTDRQTLTNGLSLTHTFNRILSGGARISREDGSDSEAKRVAYLYSATLQATPLKTLSHNLAVSLRSDEVSGEKSSNWSIFLNNMIELYEGVNLVLSEGFSNSIAATEQKTSSTIMTYGINIIPHRTFSATLYYSDTKAKQSGGNREDSDSSSQRTDLSLAYHPFQTLYLTYSYGLTQSTGKKSNTTQNYGTTWSPFPDGTIQFNIAYTETLQSDNESKNTSLSPSLRWNINKRIYLTLTYLSLKNESQLQTSQTDSFSANLTVSF